MKTVTEVPRLPERQAESHKGDYGRVLVIGGSVGMAGAPCLAANAAYRSGAGLVRLAVPEPIQAIVSTLTPLATNTGLPAWDGGTLAKSGRDQLTALAGDNDVLVIGPGLGRHANAARLVRELIAATDRPVVLDADGIRALGPNPELPAVVARRLVLTPHPGEFAALTDTFISDVQADRRAAVEAFVARCPAVLVLKGHQTIVADPGRLYVNTTGNPGMATGGSGDVLAGVIGALIGQGLEPFDAAVLGVHVHGLAGDAAAREVGMVSLTATDLIDWLPAAFQEVGAPRFSGFRRPSK